MKVVLIGCGKTKQAGPCAAADLYTGNLFQARRRFAEASDCRWWVLSAKYGLLEPSQQVRAYDVTIDDLPAADRAAWPLVIAHGLINALPSDDFDVRQLEVELHAGADYSHPLTAVLNALGAVVTWPLRGRGIGEQLAFYGTPLRLEIAHG